MPIFPDWKSLLKCAGFLDPVGTLLGDAPERAGTDTYLAIVLRIDVCTGVNQ